MYSDLWGPTLSQCTGWGQLLWPRCGQVTRRARVAVWGVSRPGEVAVREPVQGPRGDRGGQPGFCLPPCRGHIWPMSASWGSRRRAWCGLPGSGMQPRNRNRAPGQALSPGRGEGCPGAGGGGRRSDLRTRTLPTPPARLLQLPLHVPRLGFVFCGLVLRKQQPANCAPLHSLLPESPACATHWASLP